MCDICTVCLCVPVCVPLWRPTVDTSCLPLLPSTSLHSFYCPETCHVDQAGPNSQITISASKVLGFCTTIPAFTTFLLKIFI